ncbi:MAG: muraminidase [Rhodospirillaceae bacterium]|nr:muraminidase [Rhodospirillaceae bacterium]|tara:strand:+ start:23603 stop:24049 length:447 start_codon:yes stop_codon:yes gene_type:complete
MICKKALLLIKHFEGLELVPYQDSVGIWTIGYGATYGLDRKRVTKDHPVLSEEQADSLLLRDIDRFEHAVNRLVTVPIGNDQRGALISFAFNLGAGALQSATLLRRINNFEWEDVPNQFGRWVYAGGRKLPGLIRRRAAEAELWGQDI